MDKVIFTVGYGMTRVTCPLQHRRISEFIRKIATVTYDGYTRDKSGRGRQRQFYMSLYRDSCFPSGLLDKILPELDPDQYIVIDQRQKPPRDTRMVFNPDMYGKLWDHQKEAFQAAKQWNRAIFKEPTGCHGLGTRIRMHNGSVKLVEDIVIGDSVLSLDGSMQTVDELYRGSGKLFKVLIGNTNAFVINEGHVLTLSRINGELFDTALIDYMVKPHDWKASVFLPKLLYNTIDISLQRFEITYIGVGQYYGFKLSGSGRYVLENGIITHNSGKTNLAAAIINAAGVKTLYVVPTKNLLYQTYREFCQTFGRQNVGLIGDGQWSAYQPIVVATVQSLWQRYDDLVEFNRSFDDVKMLILDEAHHCNTTTRTIINKSGKEVKVQDRNTWFKIANRVPAYYRFGLTATPGDPGDESRSLLEAVTGLIRHESNTMDLVEQGILVKPKPIFYRVEHPRRYKVWRVAKETGLSGNAVRNRMIAEIALQYSLKGKLVLVVVDRVETHGRVLFDLIGPRHSLFVYGDDTTETRESAKRQFESGGIRILIGTIYGEGVNMPKVDVVINAAGGKSKKVAIQRFGRALRRSEGKSEGILIDFMDEDRGVLLEHSIERFDIYDHEGYGPVIQDYSCTTLL